MSTACQLYVLHACDHGSGRSFALADLEATDFSPATSWQALIGANNGTPPFASHRTGRHLSRHGDPLEFFGKGSRVHLPAVARTRRQLRGPPVGGRRWSCDTLHVEHCAPRMGDGGPAMERAGDGLLIRAARGRYRLPLHGAIPNVPSI
eukprot:scaffold8400_cov116-Isochrysis_galbana.AAC.3